MFNPFRHLFQTNRFNRMSYIILRNMFIFYGQFLTPRPSPKLENHPSSAVHARLFKIFAGIHHNTGRLLYPQHQNAPCRGL